LITEKRRHEDQVVVEEGEIEEEHKMLAALHGKEILPKEQETGALSLTPPLKG
jgi:hypothetical protein